MAIIIHSKDQNLDWARWNIYPDQFVPEKEKQTDEWVKSNMDYFANVAYSQFIKGKDTFVKNYNLVKGIITPEDFYIEDDKREMRSFTEELLRDVELPAYVKHYSILGPPLNTLVGELSRRPDSSMVKAFDDDSKNEELQYKTDFLTKYIIENRKNQNRAKMAQDGQKPESDDELMKMTLEQVADYLTDYTSTAEKWGARTLESLKVEMNLKEVSEDCFRDLLICSREFYHIYEDHSKSGLKIENLNPKNTWYLTLPDKKYIKDAFAAGTVHVMELSEIIERFDLSKKEVDHLRKGVRELSLFSPRESNFENPTVSGWDSIKYDTYSPYVVQERLRIEASLKENVDPLNDFLGLSNNVNTFGNKYVVVQAYWCSKIKVGKLTIVNESGEMETMLVDESYKKVPNEVEIEWNWINRWYKGFKIGSDVYKIEPFKLLDYCPIIGVVHEIKNINEARSLIDMLKPYQVLYNICLNQLYRLLDKEIGNVYLTSIRHIPLAKDGDAQDSLDIWEEEARKKGIVFVDDSPENLKSPSAFNMFKNVDLTRTQEIQSRYTLAQQLKQEAWELVGITRERTGGVAATQTATGTNAALSQSYAQTEPFFVQHEYVLNDVYQALLDAAQYIETQKPYSTISYISTEGEQAFMRVNSEDIKLRDLKVFVTSRAKDQQAFQELKQLAQPMLQNGATPYEISVLYTTSSIRQMKQIFKSLKEKMEQMQQQEMQLKEQDLKQQQAQFEYEQQRADIQDQKDKEFEHQENELDRINKKEISLINMAGKERTARNEAPPGAGVEDMNELARLSQESTNKEREYLLKREQLQQKSKENMDYIALELRKIEIERERLRAQLAMKKADIAAKKSAKKKDK
jgi:hypothetical protein